MPAERDVDLDLDLHLDPGPGPDLDPEPDPAAPPGPGRGPDPLSLDRIDQVERVVQVDAPVAAVWDLLADEDGLGSWLGAGVRLDGPVAVGAAGQVVEPDGRVRHLLVTEVDAGRTLSWQWWDDDDGELSAVEISLCPADDGSTEVRVVEAVARATVGGSIATLQADAAGWDCSLGRLGERLSCRLVGQVGPALARR